MDIEKSLSKTITVAKLMEHLSQFDGRFPVCFIDDRNNMIPLNKVDIEMGKINILLSNHTHVKDVNAIIFHRK